MYNRLSKKIKRLWWCYCFQSATLRWRYRIFFWVLWVGLWGGLCVFHVWQHHRFLTKLAVQKNQHNHKIALRKQQLLELKQWQENTWWWPRMQKPLSLLTYGAAWRRWAIKTHTQLLGWRRMRHQCHDRWCHDKVIVTLSGTWPAIEKVLYADHVLPGFLLSTRLYMQPIKSQKLQLNWQFDVFYPSE